MAILLRLGAIERHSFPVDGEARLIQPLPVEKQHGWEGPSTSPGASCRCAALVIHSEGHIRSKHSHRHPGGRPPSFRRASLSVTNWRENPPLSGGSEKRATDIEIIQSAVSSESFVTQRHHRVYVHGTAHW